MLLLHSFATGVLKCKKDRALPGGQLCPICSSPKHLQRKELQAVDVLVCSSPVISSYPQRDKPSEDDESELMTAEDFKEPFGNISLGLSDEHGNEVDLDCSIGEPRDLNKIKWEQVNQLQLASNIVFSVDLECPVGRENYEHLWRLIAYYSNVPAHLQRETMISKEPHLTYTYRQDTEKDALYYTGVRINIMAQPAWLMQTSVDLQLNRAQSTAKVVKLILSTHLSQTVEAELVRRQKRTWVMIESTNATQTVLSAVVGSATKMHCNVQSSAQPVTQWMLPDSSNVEAPYSSPDKRVSVSSDGQLIIKSVRYTDTGIYYCIARVHEELSILPFRLTVEESSSPPPVEDAPFSHFEGFAGDTILLPCTASGSPDAEINWILPDGNIVSFHTNFPKILVYANGTLQIPECQLSDTGYYKCIAINQHGVDTQATKISITRRKGLLMPLRKLRTRPQSASGVNTRIKVPTEDTVEASGVMEITQEEPPMSHLNLLKRRGPGLIGTGRRGGHPSRNMWWRPTMLRRPTGSHAEDRKHAVESRRRMNMSQNKTYSEKWADTLARIRDRSAHNTVMANPDQTTQSQDNSEGSSDGGTVHEKVVHTITPNTHHTQITHVTSTTYRLHNTHMTSKSQYRRNTSPTAIYVSYTTKHTNLNLITRPSSVIFLPQTTSIPPNTVTHWQTNTASKSSSLQEKHSTNINAVTTAAANLSTTLERSKKKDSYNPVPTSNRRRECYLHGSQFRPSVHSTDPEISHGGYGKYPIEITTTLPSYTQPLQTMLLHSQAIFTTASPTTTTVPTTTRREFEEQSKLSLSEPNSRRNGGRRRRPNRRRYKLNKTTQFIATTPVDVPLATAKPTVYMQLKIESSEKPKIAKANLYTSVPFTTSHATSPGRLSHTDSVFRHKTTAATKPPQPEIDDNPLPLARPYFESTPAPPSFPRTSPKAGEGKSTSQTTLGILESASSPQCSDMPISANQKPVTTIEKTQRDNSSGGLHTASQVQPGVVQNQSRNQNTTTEKAERMLLKGISTHLSVLPSSSSLPAPLIEHEIDATIGAHTSFVSTTAPETTIGTIWKTEQVNTMSHEAPETFYESSSQNITMKSSKEDVNLQEAANGEFNVDTPQVHSNPSSTTASRSSTVSPSNWTEHVTLHKTLSTGAKMGPLLTFTTQEGPRLYHIPENHSHGKQIPSFITILESNRTTYSHPATHSTNHNVDLVNSINLPASAPKQFSEQTINQKSTPVPTITVVNTNPHTEGLRTSTANMPRKPHLPARGTFQGDKPRIMKSNFQTITVKAETDAQLPCEVVGEPKTFLSWTKVATGMYDDSAS